MAGIGLLRKNFLYLTPQRHPCERYFRILVQAKCRFRVDFREITMKYLEWTMYALVVVALLFFLQVTFFAKSTDNHGIVDTLPAMLKYFHEDQDRLVLIVLTPTCPYCLQSYPFYRTLIAEKSKNIGVVAGINPSISIELQRRILQRENLSVDTLIALPNQDWGITLVPTIIILDDRARVEHVWIGLLDADQEKEVLSAVTQQ